MRSHIYPNERATWQTSSPAPRPDPSLNEVAVIKRLVAANSNLNVVLLTGETISGPVVWADIYNIALAIGDNKVRVILKSSAKTWDYDKSEAH